MSREITRTAERIEERPIDHGICTSADLKCLLRMPVGDRRLTCRKASCRQRRRAPRLRASQGRR